MCEQLPTAMNSGTQIVPPKLAAAQIVYLDFAGEITQYNNADLSVDLDVAVADSKLTPARIAAIAAMLNERYAETGVVFTPDVSDVSDASDYSTVYIGKNNLGYAGLAETIDSGNQIKNDEAFVNLDATDSDDRIVEVISHEVEHIVFGLAHGGDGLAAYGWVSSMTVSNGQIGSGLQIGSATSNAAQYLYVSGGGTATGTTVNSGGRMYVSGGGVANSATVDTFGSMWVQNGGTASGVTQTGGGITVISGGAIYSYIGSSGTLVLRAGAMAEDIVLYSGGVIGEMYYNTSNQLSSRGLFCHTAENSATIERMDGAWITGNASGIAVGFTPGNYGGEMLVGSCGVVSGGRIDRGANAMVARGGTISGTQVSGAVFLGNGWKTYGAETDAVAPKGSTGCAVARNLTVSSGGSVYTGADTMLTDVNIMSGAMLRVYGGEVSGTLTIAGTVSVAGNYSMNAQNGNIVFVLNDRAAADSAFTSVNTFTNAGYSVSVAANQAEGEYALLGDVTEFSAAVNLMVNGMDTGIDLNTSAQIFNGVYYQLSTANQQLTLVVSGTPVDTAVPTITNITAMPSGWTNQNVTVTAVFADNVGVTSQLYKIDGADWTAYTAGVAVTANATVYFKVFDAAGNVATAQYAVANIDKVNPTISNIGADVSGTTYDPVTVSAAFSDDHLASSLYSRDGANYLEYTSGGIQMTSNGTVWFKALDSAGNSTVSSFAVNNIMMTPDFVKLYSSGTLVSSHAVMTGETLVAGGNNSMYVSSGGTANDTTVNNSGYLNVYGGTANDTAINSGGSMVLFGASACGVTVHSGGIMSMGGGAAAGDVVLSGGKLELAYATYVSSYITGINGQTGSIGGIALTSSSYPYTSSRMSFYGNTGNIALCGGGSFTIGASAMVSNSYLDSADMDVESDGTVAALTVNGGTLRVSSGGTANDTTVNSGGWLVVSSDGTANDTTINSGGSMDLSYYASACGVTVHSGGIMSMGNNASAGNVVLSGGKLCATFSITGISGQTGSIGGIVLTSSSNPPARIGFYGNTENIAVYGGGYFSIGAGAVVSSSYIDHAGIEVESDGTVAALTVNGGTLRVSSGGMANATTVNFGDMYVLRGGTANSTTFNSGTLRVLSGGTASDTTVNNSGGLLVVLGGGMANAITVCSGGYITILRGGSASDIEVGAGAGISINVASDTYIHGTSGGSAFEMKNAYISGYTVNSGYLNVSSGGMANATTVNSGYLNVSSGGTANDTTVNSGGSMAVSSGGAISGTLQIASGAVVSAYTGANIDFTVADRTTADSALISNWNSISGGANATYTLSVGADQSTGTYQLATGAAYFANTVTVKNTSNTTLGTLSVGGTLQNGDITYSLAQTDGTLTFGIASADTPDTTAPTITNITATPSGWTNQNVTVTAVFADNVGVTSQLYKIDGGSWTDYADGVAVEFNSTVYFTAADAAGNVATAQYAVANIDKVNPTISNIGADVSGTTYDPVTVGAVFSDDHLASSLYSRDGVNYLEYTSGGIQMTSNGTVWFKAIDSAGNSTVSSFAVNNIMTEPDFVKLYSSGTLVSSHAVMTGETLVAGGNNSMYVSSGGTATSTIVNSKGILNVFSGGVIQNTKVNVYGSSYISNGGVGTDTVVSGFWAWEIVQNGGCASNTRIEYDGVQEIQAGGSAIGTVVLNKASNYVHGTAENTTVNSGGYMGLERGAIANFTTVNSGGSMAVSSGGTVSGTLQIASGAVVSAYTGANIEFTVADRTTADSALISNWNLISGGANATYTLSVGADQSTGTYQLATGAANFAGTITVKTTGDTTLGTIAVGGTLKNGDTTYSLSKTDGTLTFTINPPDTTAPTITNITATPSGWTNQDVSVTAVFADNVGVVIQQYSLNNQTWQTYESGIVMSANGIIYFKATDAAGNVTTAQYEVTNIDKIAPDMPSVSANTTAPTNQNVTVSAVFSADSAVKQYSLDNETWLAYENAVVMTANGTVYFKAADVAGNEATAQYEVTNIDKIAPYLPSGFVNTITESDAKLDWYDSADVGVAGLSGYLFRYGTTAELAGDGELLTLSEKTLTGLAGGTWYYQVAAVDKVGNKSTWSAVQSFVIATVPELKIQDDSLVSSESGVAWGAVAAADKYIVEYSCDNFETVIRMETANTAISSLNLPSGIWQWRVRCEESDEWTQGSDITVIASTIAAKYTAVENDLADIFFVKSQGQWTASFLAKNVGSIKDWTGTNESVRIAGANRFGDIFEGCNDANILYFTDDANGDALFVDDIYTDLPGSVAEQKARLAQIDEIRAGAGNDVIDMTSRRYEYIGDGLTIRGGDGNDTIWANKGDNFLFGDAGNDRLVGASGNDVLVGGASNDSMHGGGGNDIFTFGADWGVDTVEQLASGRVTLWFESGSEANWDASTLTYTDGTNSVKVIGVAAVTLKFGDDGGDQFDTLTNLGAFADSSSKKIFEDKNKPGVLAAL